MRSRPLLRPHWATGVLVITMLLAGCGQSSDSDGAASSADPSSDVLTVNWGGPKNLCLLPIIAERMGYFSDEGVDARPNYLQTGKIAMDAVVSGDIDIGIIVDTNIAFVGFQEGAGVSVVASAMEKFDDAIVARTDMGINEPKDIEGKQLAILTGTTSHRFADLFIDFYGLDRSTIEFVNLSPPSIQASLIQGVIPAGSIWQPYGYNVEQAVAGGRTGSEGAGAIQFNDRDIYKAYALVAARQQFVRENGGALDRYLRALIRAEEFVADNPDEAIAIFGEELSIEADVLRTFWDDYVPTVKLDMELIEVFRSEGEWIVEFQRGFEKRSVPTYDDIIDPAPLSTIDASRVVGGSEGS